MWEVELELRCTLSDNVGAFLPFLSFLPNCPNSTIFGIFFQISTLAFCFDFAKL